MTVDPKRVFDVAVSGVGLVLASPVLAGVAVAVRLDSRGPAFFRQERVGRNGELFRIHKFRSLRTDMPGALISPTHDPRITRVGAVLRRTKLDELPQLLDVLAGHMSLVGPRPEVPRYVELWPAAERELILSVRPGITDPASVALRNEAEELAGAEDPEQHYVSVLLPRKVAMYADYVRSRNFLGDLGIIASTLRTVLRD
ncbi:O-antigen biosynthesis protein WlbG [Microlunatus panaciterrae]|uniref:Lipopolysaccharide/colanic/teichoic acid biosynthesis glycosyltransferase n=1 Tax=Microlunatus panaciterrae TaxID=400768 RepID=A0ABS2RHQ9_9ACTN|nr:sugar transferase [Microlunatus panaciterrae]MBM7798536.1 lipopolysaccharide/colanic/teichoic acid biosynthesis glycosyltransferase [Microlunatus panaciterrae]